MGADVVSAYLFVRLEVGRSRARLHEERICEACELDGKVIYRRYERDESLFDGRGHAVVPGLERAELKDESLAGRAV